MSTFTTLIPVVRSAVEGNRMSRQRKRRQILIEKEKNLGASTALADVELPRHMTHGSVQYSVSCCQTRHLNKTRQKAKETTANACLAQHAVKREAAKEYWYSVLTAGLQLRFSKQS